MPIIEKEYKLEYHDLKLTFCDSIVRLVVLDKAGNPIYEQEFGRREFFQFYVALNRFTDDINDAILAAKPKH